MPRRNAVCRFLTGRQERLSANAKTEHRMAERMRRMTAFSLCLFCSMPEKTVSQLFFREVFAEPCYSGTIRGSKPIPQKKKP